MTLLIIGELGDNVVDWRTGTSEKLGYYERQRLSGNHVCMVDDAGITALLDHRAAPCLESRMKNGTVQFRTRLDESHSLPAPESDEHQRGAAAGSAQVQFAEHEGETSQFIPVELAKDPTHDTPAALGTDMAALDRATARHNATLRLLIEHLAPATVHGLSSPKVDAAWADPSTPRTLLVGEVKSLAGTNETQQIRLGIGQVLDYVHQVRQSPPMGFERVQPILVLEHEPVGTRWTRVAESAGLVLTWAPDFPAI